MGELRAEVPGLGGSHPALRNPGPWSGGGGHEAEHPPWATVSTSVPLGLHHHRKGSQMLLGKSVTNECSPSSFSDPN